MLLEWTDTTTTIIDKKILKHIFSIVTYKFKHKNPPMTRYCCCLFVWQRGWVSFGGHWDDVWDVEDSDLVQIPCLCKWREWQRQIHRPAEYDN